MQEFSIIGKSVPRVDALEKVTGRAQYGSDVELPGMLHAKVLRSKYPHARIISIDTNEAEKLPGVKAVITAEDTPRQKMRVSQPGWSVPDYYPLAVDKVRYVGQEVAAVAAEDELIAEEALGLIRVEYEELPAVFDPEEAMKPGAPRLHEELEGNIGYEINTEFGDVDRGFKEADHIFEDRFTTPYNHTSPLEPMVCIADFDSSGKLIFYENSCEPFVRSRLAARALGITGSKVKVVQNFLSGNFGTHHCDLSPYVVTAILAKKTGRPVRLVNTREEELSAGRPRMPMILHSKVGVKKDGTITARHLRIISTAGAHPGFSARMITMGFVLYAGLYKCPNLRFNGKCTCTNTLPVGPNRSYGGEPNVFALDSHMDIIAEKLGIDPIEFRLKNATRTGDVTVVGQQINSCGLPECAEKVVNYVGWRERRAKKQPNRGIGVAFGIAQSNDRETTFDGSIAYVKILTDGRVRIISGEYEWGQGGHTILSQIAAEELGIPLEAVDFSRPLDTDVLPYTLGPYGGGRLTITGGHAMRLAAIDAKRQLITIAAKMLGARFEDLEMKNQKILVSGAPERSLSIAEVARYATYRLGEEVIGKGVWDADTVITDPKTGYGNYSTGYTFLAQIAEVEVDPETGEVKILDFAAASDVGRAINPMSVEGQSEGGIAQEIGVALKEEIMYEQGIVVNPNFIDYGVPTALDIPPIKTFIVETNDPNCPYGAKAAGYIGFATAAALANAIYNAVGVRIKELPITPMKIVKALDEKGRGR